MSRIDLSLVSVCDTLLRMEAEQDCPSNESSISNGGIHASPRILETRRVQRGDDQDRRLNDAGVVLGYVPWASTDAPPGRLDMTRDDVPEKLRTYLSAVVQSLRKPGVDEVTGDELYKNVSHNTGTDKYRVFTGWKVQYWLGTSKGHARVGFTLLAYVAALLYAGAAVDPRLRTQRSAHKWIVWLVDVGEAAVDEWIASLDALCVPAVTGANPGEKRGRPAGRTSGGVTKRKERANDLAYRHPLQVSLPDGSHWRKKKRGSTSKRSASSTPTDVLNYTVVSDDDDVVHLPQAV